VSVCGSVNFMVYFHSSAQTARRLTCRILRMGEAELDRNETVNDTIGELANMLAGQIKLKMAQSGHVCWQTAPTVVRGSSFRVIAPSTSLRRTIGFNCRAGSAALEAMFMPGTAPKRPSAPR
jgi:chemotaxis protein CheX